MSWTFDNKKPEPYQTLNEKDLSTASEQLDDL
ncbi:Uncharacterised protein [Mycobacterium tuberculosis]|nr:Uncharacterised protein [Mycobacterium tuberculosis]